MSKDCNFCKGKYIRLSPIHTMLDWMCMRIEKEFLLFATSRNNGLGWGDRGRLKINYCPICGRKLGGQSDEGDNTRKVK